MATEVLDLETAFELNIINVSERIYFAIPFQRFANDGTTPEDWPDYPYTFSVSANRSGTPNLFSLRSIDGQITVVDNLLLVTCLDSENLMNGSKTYYYDLVADLGGDKTRPYGFGKIMSVKYSITK
jgi:hypothetical protein